MDNSGGIRDEWARLVGRPNEIGVELNVVVSDTNQKSTEYLIRGIVDVPSHPRGDDERNYLAKRLFQVADIPDKGKRRFELVSWEVKLGGAGTHIRRCRPIPILNDKNLINLHVFTPPGVEVLSDSAEIGDEEHNEWVSEYVGNRYCRFESRKELHRRFQDIHVNTQVLKASGLVGLTDDPLWFRLSQHVITEMLLRGQPPNNTNKHPGVQDSGRFFDGELCAKTAAVVAANGSRGDLVVKYGKSEHMKSLFEDGLIYLNPASAYDKSTHNAAKRDDERTIVFKGAYSPADDESRFFNSKTAPDDVGELTLGGDLKFTLMFYCPSIAYSELAEHSVHMGRDYWMFCMADVLDQRLFVDFDADSCVIIQRDPLMRRLARYSDSVLVNTTKCFTNVRYVDPLGAFPGSHESLTNGSLPIHLTKLFRYAYQREVRFVCIPREVEERLEPHQIRIGSLKDIAEYVQL